MTSKKAFKDVTVPLPSEAAMLMWTCGTCNLPLWFCKGKNICRTSPAGAAMDELLTDIMSCTAQHTAAMAIVTAC